MHCLWFESALLPNGWAAHVRVTLAGGRIARVETQAEPTAADERHHVAIPGLPNVHSHCFQRALAGRAERSDPTLDDDFWGWRRAMYHLLEAFGPDDFEVVARLAFAEMLESGFTRVGEFHYLHHDEAGQPYSDIAELAQRVLAAATSTGIRVTLLPVFYAHANFGGVPAEPGQRRFVTSLADFARLFDQTRAAAAQVPGTIVGIAPHSLRAVTPAELSHVLGLARGNPVHLHIAEQTREVEACLAWSGRRPIAWLLDEQPVDSSWTLVHATHATEPEYRGIAQRGAVVGLCPITEANLGDGVFPALAFTRANGRFAVGSDSNVLVDAAAELRQLEYGQRLVHRARNVMGKRGAEWSTGRSLVEQALNSGYQSLGVEESARGLIAGAPGDLVSFRPEHPDIAERRGDAWLDGWIFAARHGAIDRVWVGGREVVANGIHIDRQPIEAGFRRLLRRLWGGGKG